MKLSQYLCTLVRFTLLHFTPSMDMLGFTLVYGLESFEDQAHRGLGLRFPGGRPFRSNRFLPNLMSEPDSNARRKLTPTPGSNPHVGV